MTTTSTQTSEDSMTATQTQMPGLFDFGVKREMSAIVQLHAYRGWSIRKLRDEHGRYTFTAHHYEGAMSPLEASWEDAMYFVRHGEPVVR